MKEIDLDLAKALVRRLMPKIYGIYINGHIKGRKMIAPDLEDEIREQIFECLEKNLHLTKKGGKI